MRLETCSTNRQIGKMLRTQLNGTSVLTLRALRPIAQRFDPASRRLRKEIRTAAALVPPAERALDIGSGRAPYAGFFQHQQYVTVDLFARADVRCTASELPFGNSTFDLILCTEVLEHVPDPDETLREVRRALTPTGFFVLTTPLTWGVHEAFDFHRWTEMGLRQLLRQHGMECIQLRSRGGIFVTLSALLLVIPWQVFGPAQDRPAWRTALFGLTYTLLFPLAAVISLLDFADRTKGFTHGYVALCRLAPTDRG